MNKKKTNNHKFWFYALIVVAVMVAIPMFYNSLQFWEGVSEAKTIPVTEQWVPPTSKPLYLSIDDKTVIVAYIMRINPDLNPLDVDRIVQKVSNKRHKWVILSIMKKESHFNPEAFSKKKVKTNIALKGKHPKYVTRIVPLAIGLTAVNVCNVKELISEGVITKQDDLFNIEKNIDSGLYMFEKYLKETKGNTTLALKYYFNGPSNVKKNPNRPDYLTYVNDIYRGMGELVSRVETAHFMGNTIKLASK